MASARTRDHILLVAAVAGALVTGTLTAAGAAPGRADDPAVQALARLDADADGPLTMRMASGGADFVGVPDGVEVDHPSVTRDTSVAAAADAVMDRYGPAFGTSAEGSRWVRGAPQQTVTGDVVRYEQRVDDVPVVGGGLVVSLRDDHELSSILGRTSATTRLAAATVDEGAAEATARAVFERSSPGVGEVGVESRGRWVLDARVIGGDATAPTRTVWRFEVSRGVAERRQIMVDDRTGGVLMDVDEIETVNRVVCDDGNTPRNRNLAPPACTGPAYARSEGGAATGNTDVDLAYDLAQPVSDLYAAIGVDLTDLIGRTVSGGAKALAQTVNYCPTATPLPPSCPGYENAFWNGSQMYYGAGFATADDVVGHEMTHGVTERTSGLFYWGQSGAMNESLSDIMGEIVDHRHALGGEDLDSWRVGEDLPGSFAGGIRDMEDPTVFGHPDRTGSSFYQKDGTAYPDNDGVHTNSGVGNKTFYLISQGGTFNGHTVTGIDAGDQTLTKSARLWLLVDQSLSSASDWADQAAVLDQSCQALVTAAVGGFTAGDCTQVHQATLATELLTTPVNNPQAADAARACPGAGVVQELLNSETGTPDTKFVAGATWARSGELAHSGTSSWVSSEPSTVGASSLTATAGITLPAGQPAYLIFDRWHVLDYDAGGFYDALTVEIDDTGDAVGPVDAAPLPWVNGPVDLISSAFSNPASGRSGFGGDSRGYLASRVDLSSYAGRTIKPQFTMNTDSSVTYVGLGLDDVIVYTCATPVVGNSVAPSISGTPQVGRVLTAAAGSWQPGDVTLTYQWLRSGSAIGGATSATYAVAAADVGRPLSVRVTGTKAGYTATSATSAATGAVSPGALVRGKPRVTGKAVVGQTLRVKPGSWQPGGVTFRYQWLRNGKPIARATRTTYRLANADKGKRLSVRVTGAKAGHTTAAATSATTAKVRPKPRKRR